MTPRRQTKVAATWSLWLVGVLIAASWASPLRAQPTDGLQEAWSAVEPQPPVSVHVRDAVTGAALGDVVVACGAGPAAITDSSGMATLPGCAGPLDVSRDGYLPVRLDRPASGQAEVALVPARRAAESVTVVGPASGQTEAGVPAQIAVTREDLAMLRSVTFDDPLRTLQQLPGVATSDELRAELSVRGSPFRQVGLVLDEVKSRLLVHTVRGVEQTGSVALLNADLLDAATLTSGAGPQRFGNTVGAELGIRTRAGRADGFHGRGMASAIAATGFVEGPVGTDRVTLIAGARRSYASWIVRKVDPDVSGTFEFTDVQGKIDARLSSRQSVSAGLLAGTSTYDERGRRSGSNALDVGRNETAMGTLAWQAQVGSRWIVRQRVAGISSRYRNANPDDRPLDRGTEHEWLSRSIVEWAPAPAWSLDGAAQVQHFTSRASSIVYDPTSRDPEPEVATTGTQTLAGGHLHARWSPHRAVTVGSGIRVDRVIDLETFAGGWVQGQVALSPAVVVTGAISRHGQAPDVLQRFGPAGTPDLVFERATLVDGGLAWRRGAWGVAANVYARRESDGLDTPDRQFRLTPDGRVTGGNPRAPWTNALSGRARGLELLVRRQSAPGVGGIRWSGWIGYGVGRARYASDLDPAFPGAFEQRHLLTVSATAQVGARWDVSGTLRLATNWPYDGWYETRADGRVYLSAQRNDLRIPDYGRLDLRARYRVALPHGRLLLFAEVINATNAENLRQVSASIDPRTGAVGRLSERQLPIIPAIGAAYEF